MVESSPLRRRSQQLASPARSVLSDILNEDLDRNSEARHRSSIYQAALQRERVREEAQRIYEAHLQHEAHLRLLEEKKQQEERIRKEEQLAAERKKIIELQKKQVEIPQLPPPLPKPPATTTSTLAPAPSISTSTLAPSLPAPSALPSLSSVVNGQVPSTQTSSPFSGPTNGFHAKPAASPFSSPLPSQPPTTSPFAAFKSSAPAAQTSAPKPASTPVPQPLPSNGSGSMAAKLPISKANGATANAQTDQYMVVHKNLKELRKFMEQQKATNPGLKNRLGEMRREVRKTMGQLSTDNKANKQQHVRITQLLREALANQMNSAMVDPSKFVLEPRERVQPGSGDDSLPSLFIYILNIISKAIITQFVKEAGPRPEQADPLGVVAALTFSDAAFHWRGQSMIDILLAKYRVVCPVVFGYNGDDTTERGKDAVGWRRSGRGRISEEEHMDRQTGLGSGFAAISLRNFKRSKNKNPYPPRHYWQAMAKIVNTPSAEISTTQAVVLKAMIQNYEARFLEAYGTAGIAALRLALVDWPGRAVRKSPAVRSLGVLATELKQDQGLDLTR